MRLMLITAAAIAVLAAPAHAEAGAAVRSAIFVERPQGLAGRTIETTNTFNRGDRVVMILDWQAARRGQATTVTARVPHSLVFQRSSNGLEEVSADGGRNWGRLGQLRLRDDYGPRLASPEDITHVRWRLRGPEASGRITYSARVR